MEAVRRVIRSALGYNSRLYKAGAKALNFVATVSKDGIQTWSTLESIRHNHPDQEKPCLIALKSLNHPMLLRPGTTDVSTIINNVIREEYGHFTVPQDPEWMIDAGAYIGDTTAYFLSRFPKLKVIALEPNPESYRLARLNLEPYGDRVILLQKALYSSEDSGFFSGNETGAALSTAGFEVECVTVPWILEQYAISKLDILKMDIEGAEEAVFSLQPDVWLKRTGLIIVEIHGPHIQKVISSILIQNNFSMHRYRSVWYCRENSQ